VLDLLRLLELLQLSSTIAGWSLGVCEDALLVHMERGANKLRHRFSGWPKVGPGHRQWDEQWPLKFDDHGAWQKRGRAITSAKMGKEDVIVYQFLKFHICYPGLSHPRGGIFLSILHLGYNQIVCHSKYRIWWKLSHLMLYPAHQILPKRIRTKLASIERV